MTFPTRSDVRWFSFVAGGWLMLLSVAAFVNLVPASQWLRVELVHVYDTPRDADPQMLVVREIVRPFRADWIATVQKLQSSGGYSNFCTARGANDYRPDNVLPEDLRLSWWTFPLRCDLPPGRYRVLTLWVIQPPGFPPKEVRATSNEFRVFD